MKIYEKSFINFVYPFLFDEGSFLQRVKAVKYSKWEGGKKPLEIWKEEKFPEDDLLPHVAHYLNPPEETEPTAELWQIDNNTLQSCLGKNGKWKLVYPHGETNFSIDSIKLSLFRIGVGFLTVCVMVGDNDPAKWLDFLHYFRFIKRENVRINIQRSTKKDVCEPFFPEPAGGTDKHPDGTGNFAEIVNAILLTGAIDSDTKPWWKEVFVPNQLLPFAVLYADEVPDDEIPILPYMARNFFHSRQEIRPTKEDLRPDHPAMLPYIDGMWLTFSLNGGTFVACNAPDTPFFRSTLLDHLGKQYFLIFLMALQQRFSLIMLSEEVAKCWLMNKEECKESAFERIHNLLLLFTARGNFTQIMQQENHHRFYRKWQETFQLDKIYNEVSGEIHEMHDYLLGQQIEKNARAEAERDRSLERIIWFLGLPGLTLAFLDAITEKITIPIAFICSAIAFAVGVFLYLLINYILRRKQKAKQKLQKEKKN